jgi:hypothetical protein
VRQQLWQDFLRGVHPGLRPAVGVIHDVSAADADLRPGPVQHQRKLWSHTAAAGVYGACSSRLGLLLCSQQQLLSAGWACMSCNLESLCSTVHVCGHVFLLDTAEGGTCSPPDAWGTTSVCEATLTPGGDATHIQALQRSLVHQALRFRGCSPFLRHQ